MTITGMLKMGTYRACAAVDDLVKGQGFGDSGRSTRLSRLQGGGGGAALLVATVRHVGGASMDGSARDVDRTAVAKGKKAHDEQGICRGWCLR